MISIGNGCKIKNSNICDGAAVVENERKLIPNRPYMHFKGKPYYVHGIAEDSETGQKMVCYQALYPPYKTYVREYENFMSKVDRAKYPDAKQEYRFEPMEDCEVIMCRKKK